MRVADLIDLGLRPLAVDDPGFDRVLRWVYTTDLPDPRPFIYGGELVLTSEGWYDGTVDSCRRFVGALVDRAAAALVVGDILHGKVPEPIIEIARSGGLPLLFAPAEVSYNALSQEVTQRISADRHNEATATAGEYRQLITALVTGHSSAELLTVTARQSGLQACAMSAVGRVIASSSDHRPLSPGDRDTIIRKTLAAVRLPLVVTLTDRTATISAVGRRTARAGYLVVDGDIDDWKARQRRIIDETTELLSLSMLADAERFWQGQAAQQVWARMLADDSTSDGRVRERLRQAGIDVRQPTVVVSLTAADAHRDGTIAADLVVTTIGTPEAALVLSQQEPERSMTVFLPWEGEVVQFAEKLEDRARRLTAALAGSTIRAGVAAIEGSVRSALEAAREARRLAAAQGGDFAVATARDIDTYAGLLAQVPAQRRAAFRTRVLGGVLDDPSSAEHLRTLEAFLRHNGSWQRAADELHIHVSTLHYRIGRIESLLGRNLAALPDRVDCYLALQITDAADD